MLEVSNEITILGHEKMIPLFSYFFIFFGWEKGIDEKIL